MWRFPQLLASARRSGYWLVIGAVILGVAGGFSLHAWLEVPRTTLGKLVLMQPLANGGAIYGFVFDQGNATVGDVYRYFILPQTGDPETQRSKARSKSPFLVTSAVPQTLQSNGNVIRVVSSERVFAFASQDGFYVGETWHPVSVSLTQVSTPPAS